MVGGALVVVLLLFVLPRDEPAQPSLAPPPPEARPPAASPAPPAMAAPAPAPDASQLRLAGLLATGAIIGTAGGNQRFVPLGRDVVPGLTLRRVELHHAILASAGGEVRLGFDGAAQSGAAPAPAAAETDLRDETLRYRLGLAPRRAGGRIAGFTLRPGASMPALERAGLRPGDVILAVNGSTFDEERMLELAWQMANSSRTEFEIERGGRRLKIGAGRR